MVKGYRECAKRYEIIKSFCAKYDRPFTVCDIGANWCYFGLRLTEDFPDCSVVAFEYNSVELRRKHLLSNSAERILLIGNKLHLDDLYVLGMCCRFDVVLAMSVIHHMSGPFPETIRALRDMGDNVIVELAMDDSPRTRNQVHYGVPGDGIILGYGESHKQEGAFRPIVLLPDRGSK